MALASIWLSYRSLRAENGSTEIEAHLPKPLGRPFLKWAGGKQWASPLFSSLVSSDFSGSYFEPFLGAGAAFFSAAPAKAHLSDTSVELVRTFEVVRDDVEKVIAVLRTFRNEREFYESIRRRRTRTPVTSAARFIYLNRTAFNGLYRVNREGLFNVPFGRYKNPTICQAGRLRDASRLLAGRALRVADFEDAVEGAVAGDIVYLDPPYITGHRNNGFLKYNARLFDWGDQERLAGVAADLRSRGVHIFVSNADHPAVLALYGGFHRYRMFRSTLIGGPSDTRRQISEALLTSSKILNLTTEVIDG